MKARRRRPELLLDLERESAKLELPADVGVRQPAYTLGEKGCLEADPIGCAPRFWLLGSKVRDRPRRCVLCQLMDVGLVEAGLLPTHRRDALHADPDDLEPDTNQGVPVSRQLLCV